MPQAGYTLYDLDLIKSLCDGKRYSKDIAVIVGCSAKYVQQIMKKYNLPRTTQGAQLGTANSSYRCGRTIDRDGYVLVSAPKDHPSARILPGKNRGRILEHRLVMEKEIGRYLLPDEVVDHKDGLHLHNDPSNLRVFHKNTDHLKKTIAGQRPAWSKAGFEKMQIVPHLRPSFERVDMYGQRKKRGEVRVQQILLALLSLGKDSPYLLGTRQYLEQAQVDCSTPTTIKQALNHLYLQWGWPLVP